jgi:phenylalanyl-tRNA synthetase alpha chain
MDALSVAKTLHPLEVRILLAYDPGSEIDGETVRRELNFREGQENQAFSWLLAKGLIEEKGRSQSLFFELTALGREYAEKGTPERRIFDYIRTKGAARLPELAETLALEQKSVGSAFGLLSKEGALGMNEEGYRVHAPAQELEEQ